MRRCFRLGPSALAVLLVVIAAAACGSDGTPSGAAGGGSGAASGASSGASGTGAASGSNIGPGGSGTSAQSGSPGSAGGAGGSGAGGSGGSGGSGATSGTAGATGSASGASGGSRDASTGSGDAAGAACLGSSVLAALGKSHLLVGGSMQDATAKQAPFDLRYVYISGGLFDGTSPCTSCASGCTTKGTTCASSGPGCAWWGCWQYDQDPPGAYARTFEGTCAGASPPQLPMFTYYEILQASGVTEGKPEVTQAATDPALMTRYFADWRFLLQQVGQKTALLHIEPDFWGYAEQTGSDPHALTAAVASANATDCAGVENSIAGMGRCMVAMVRKYAPHALVGLHASAWGTNVDVAANTSPTFDVAGEAQKLAAFLTACGEADADFVVVETSDRDAGYYQSQGRNTWWDATNATLPDFHQDFARVKALTEALGKPALYWQTPLGNMGLNDTTNHWKDNRVDYFFGHMGELAGAHAIGAAFGAGAGDQTSPESDNGNFVAKAKAYFGGTGGGQALCP